MKSIEDKIKDDVKDKDGGDNEFLKDLEKADGDGADKKDDKKGML